MSRSLLPSQTTWFSSLDVEWRVRTDKTERPEIGASSLEVVVEKTVQAKGLLHALPGKSGTVNPNRWLEKNGGAGWTSIEPGV